MGCPSRSRWFFGTLKLAHPTCFSKPPKGSLTLYPYTFPQPESPLGEGQKKEMGWGPCCHSGCLRPWHKGLGSRPPSGGGRGEEWPPGHGVTFRGPQRRAPGPSLPRTAPPSAPWPWRGLDFCPPSLLGPERSGGHRENVGRRKRGGTLEMGQGLRWTPGGP